VIYPNLASLRRQFILDNALRAEAEGYDVLAIGFLHDSELEEARSLLGIPGRPMRRGSDGGPFCACVDRRQPLPPGPARSVQQR
jgi:hypothetical protein